MALAATSACTEQRERAPAQAERMPQAQPQQPPGPAPVKVDELKEEPARYYDKQVQVVGKVDDLYSDRAFKLEGTGWAFNDDITVLLKAPVAASIGPLGRRDEIIVNGTVRRFVVADVERDVGWDLAPELEIKLKERPVLVADSVRRVGAAEKPQEQPQARAEGPVSTVAAIVLAKDPKSLAGQKVDFTRERVQAMAGKGLWVGPTAATQVFVVPPTIPKDLAVGDTVQLSGTLREVPANAQQMWAVPADTAGQIKDAAVYIEAETLQELPAETDERRH